MNATFTIDISNDKVLKMNKYGDTGKKLRYLKQMVMNYTMILPTETMPNENEQTDANQRSRSSTLRIPEYLDLSDAD